MPQYEIFSFYIDGYSKSTQIQIFNSLFETDFLKKTCSYKM